MILSVFLSSKQDMASSVASQLSPDSGLTRSATSGKLHLASPRRAPQPPLAPAQTFLPRIPGMGPCFLSQSGFPTAVGLAALSSTGPGAWALQKGLRKGLPQAFSDLTSPCHYSLTPLKCKGLSSLSWGGGEELPGNTGNPAAHLGAKQRVGRPLQARILGSEDQEEEQAPRSCPITRNNPGPASWSPNAFSQAGAGQRRGDATSAQGG